MELVQLAEFPGIPKGTQQYFLEFINHKRSLKLEETDDLVKIGVVDPDNFSLQAELRSFHEKDVRFYRIEDQELAEYLTKQFSASSVLNESGQDERILLDRLANDAPIINLVNSVLLEGIRLGCSDIHIESITGELFVRYRVDGVLYKNRTMKSDVFPGVSSRIKIMANLNIIEKRLPQDGRLTVHLGGNPVEFRVSIVPLHQGESIVLRLFHRNTAVTQIDSLGFSSEHLKTLRNLGQYPNGLILMTGPTGSGKTTTLNSLLKELISDSVKIITVEDPVENQLQGVNQIQTNEAIGLTFDSILRRILRQDPDILMVGEIRDRRTAELAIRSALTGHLVFSSLHTNDALASIPRLLNMGMEPYLLSGVLRGVAAQRLVRKLCPHCRAKQPATPSQMAFLEKHGQDWNQVYMSPGCKECHNTGYKGRTVIAEVFTVDETVEDLIVHEKKHRDFVQHYKKLGQTFLVQDGLEKARLGLTSLADVERAVLRS